MGGLFLGATLGALAMALVVSNVRAEEAETLEVAHVMGARLLDVAAFAGLLAQNGRSSSLRAAGRYIEVILGQRQPDGYLNDSTFVGDEP